MKPNRTARASRALVKKSAAALGQMVRVLKHSRSITPAAPPVVVLKLRAPAAKEVFVAGSFNGWKVGVTPLIPVKGGEWQGDLKLTPGRYEYLFVVDGTWLPDPAAHEMSPNPFGGWNSVLSVN